MDTHPDDLTDMERRLAAWQPAADGLDADCLMFAAGRASVRGRVAWPVLAACLALLAAGLGAWGVAERHERQALAQLIRGPYAPAPAPLTSEPPSSPEPPSPYSVLASHRVLERGLDAWPGPALGPQSPPEAERSILRARQIDALLGS